MKVYKLKTFVSGENGDVFKDIYFDVERITAFYIPEKALEHEDIDGEMINLLHDGDLTTVKQEAHIIKYLRENFVENAINK